MRVPETPIYLDAILADEALTGGLEPRLGRRASAHPHHHRVSRRRPGPVSSTSSTVSPFPIAGRPAPSCLDKTDATKLLGKIRRQWFAKRKSIMAILKEVMTNEASVLVDSDAANKAADADAALQELGADLVGEAYVTATVTVWDEDARIADEKLRLVEKIIQGRDFTCMMRERQCGRSLARQPARPRLCQCPPAADLDAQSRPHDAALGGLGGAGTGRASCRAPPLFFGKTEGSTPVPASASMSVMSATP